jgi:hypothetical protein
MHPEANWHESNNGVPPNMFLVTTAGIVILLQYHSMSAGVSEGHITQDQLSMGIGRERRLRLHILMLSQVKGYVSRYFLQWSSTLSLRRLT